MDDVGVPSGSHVIHGHGTQVAILAAGCKTGVARKANLYLIKMMEVVMKSGRVEEILTGPDAQLQGMRKVISVVGRSEVPRGKAVLVMCSGNWRVDVMRGQFGARWETTMRNMKNALLQLDFLGVTVVMAAGNDGVSANPQQDPGFVPRYVDQQFPQNIATADSPLLVVGSTNSQGQLSVFSTPGRGNTPVSLYAQGEAVNLYDLQLPNRKLKSGTSYSAPIVVRAPGLESPEFLMLT